MNDPVTMTTLLGDVQVVVTKIISVAGDVLNFIMGNPILLFGFTLSVIGLAINLVRKFAYR